MKKVTFLVPDSHEFANESINDLIADLDGDESVQLTVEENIPEPVKPKMFKFWYKVQHNSYPAGLLSVGYLDGVSKEDVVSRFKAGFPLPVEVPKILQLNKWKSC
jgi:hypothetical protein